MIIFIERPNFFFQSFINSSSPFVYWAIGIPNAINEGYGDKVISKSVLKCENDKYFDNKFEC